MGTSVTTFLLAACRPCVFFSPRHQHAGVPTTAGAFVVPFSAASSRASRSFPEMDVVGAFMSSSSSSIRQDGVGAIATKGGDGEPSCGRTFEGGVVDVPIIR